MFSSAARLFTSARRIPGRISLRSFAQAATATTSANTPTSSSSSKLLPAPKHRKKSMRDVTSGDSEELVLSQGFTAPPIEPSRAQAFSTAGTTVLFRHFLRDQIFNQVAICSHFFHVIRQRLPRRIFNQVAAIKSHSYNNTSFNPSTQNHAY